MSIIDRLLNRPSRKVLTQNMNDALGDCKYWSDEYTKLKRDLEDANRKLQDDIEVINQQRKDRDTYRKQRDELTKEREADAAVIRLLKSNYEGIRDDNAKLEADKSVLNLDRANWKKEADRLSEVARNYEATNADLLGQITRRAEETSKLEAQIERLQKSIDDYLKLMDDQTKHIRTLRMGIYDAIARLLSEEERNRIDGKPFMAEELIKLLQSSLTTIIDSYNSISFMINMTEEEKRAAFVAFQGGVNDDPRFKHFAVMILFQSLKQSLLNGQAKVTEVGVGDQYVVRISKTEDRDVTLQSQADFAEALEILDDRLAIMNCPNLTDDERKKVEGVVERAIEVMDRCRLAEQQSEIDRAQNEARRNPEPEAITQEV